MQIECGKGGAPLAANVGRLGVQPGRLVKALHSSLVVADRGEGRPGAPVRSGVGGIVAYGLGILPAGGPVVAERGEGIRPRAAYPGVVGRVSTSMPYSRDAPL